MKETAGTLTNTTVSIDADPQRNGLIISNNSDTVMTWRPAGTATANIGISVPAGQAVNISEFVGRALAKGSSTLFCAGTSKAYTYYDF